MTDNPSRSQNMSGLWCAPASFGDMGKKQVDATVEMQKEFFGTLEQISRAWLARAQSEAGLASDLVGKLATARSIPDAASAYQECMTRQMEMIAEDYRRMIADGERLMRAGIQAFNNGSSGLST